MNNSLRKSKEGTYSKTVTTVLGGSKTELRLVTKLEEKHYAQLKKNLETNNVNEDDTNHIIHHMF